MIFTRPLSKTTITDDLLKKDKASCKKFGPCGVGEKAFYLNSFYLDRCYYVPVSSVTRVFKRVAMSKGGFTGKGIFATLPYLVVLYDNGTEKQCLFKREEQVDEMLEYIRVHFPDIKLKSEAIEAAEKLRAEQEAAIVYPEISRAAQGTIKKLVLAKKYLEQKPALYEALTRTAKNKRVNERSNPTYRWVALAIVIMAAVCMVYGVYAVVTHAGFGLYFLLFGLAAIFLFSGANVLPTKENNAAYIAKQWEDACANMEEYLSTYDKCSVCNKAGKCDKQKKDGKVSTFPVPARYAHPALLERMIQIVKFARAESFDDALEIAKEDLKKINSSVTVEQWEYDQIMAVKPMFLVENYK